jgi:hypothetical protein
MRGATTPISLRVDKREHQERCAIFRDLTRHLPAALRIAPAADGATLCSVAKGSFRQLLEKFKKPLFRQ